MSKHSKHSKQDQRAKRTAEIIEARRAELLDILAEIRGGPDSFVWGTAPCSLGRVKAASEEARLATCPECGYGGGRHARSCELRPTASAGRATGC